MRRLLEFVARAVGSGLLLAVPVYLAVLLLLKGMKSLTRVVQPLAALHPPGMSSAAAEQVVALFLIVTICFVLGAATLTAPGRVLRKRIEGSVLEKIPGYALVRSWTQQVAGKSHEDVWKPALVELGASTVLAFIIEEIDDQRYTVFVPSVPSPLSGSLHILRRERVHPVNVSFAQTFRALSRWGSGARQLVATLEAEERDRELKSKAS
jgi:uncharacterized membrane protein